MKTRIYAVQVLAPHADGTLHEKVFLVDATSRRQAESHVAKQYVSAEIADGKTIARLMAKGVTVSQAAQETEEPQAATLPGVPETLDIAVADEDQPLPADATFEELEQKRKIA